MQEIITRLESELFNNQQQFFWSHYTPIDGKHATHDRWIILAQYRFVALMQKYGEIQMKMWWNSKQIAYSW